MTWSYIFCIFLHFLSIQTTVPNLEIDWIANRDWSRPWFKDRSKRTVRRRNNWILPCKKGSRLLVLQPNPTAVYSLSIASGFSQVKMGWVWAGPNFKLLGCKLGEYTSHKPFFFIKFYTFHGLSTQSSIHHHCWRLKSVLDFTKFNK